MRTKLTLQPGGGVGAGAETAGARSRRTGIRRVQGRPCGARRGIACASALAGALAFGPDGIAAGEPAIACGSNYTVAQGDTLFSIAARTYGDGQHFRAIFDFNTDVLSSTDSIDVGNRLLVPCLDGTEVGSRPIVMPVPRSTALQSKAPEFTEPAAELAQANGPAANAPQTGGPVCETAIEVLTPVTAALPAAETAGPVQTDAAPVVYAATAAARAPEASAPEARPSESSTPEPSTPGSTALESQALAASVTVSMDRQAVLVAGTVAPYADNALPAGGMITDLISQALETAVPDWPYTVGFRGDWSPSAPALHLDEAFDIGFPSIKPDCSPDAFMSARIRQVCESYEFSRPILLAEVAYYGRNGDPVLQGTSAIDLSGQRVCTGDERPETERNPLNTAAPYSPAEPAPALERCFEQLAGGKTDVVVGLKAAGDATIDMLGLDGAVSEIEGLRSEQTLHAFAPKGNAYALEVLKALDQGIGDLMISGRWFEIVSSHETNRVAFLAR